MIVTRKNLAREALDRALEVREEAKIAFNVPLCVYGLCDRLGVRVHFVDINMEGLYLASERPFIQISSLRPLGRRVFNGGHELGHHVFGHGSTLDELQEERQATGTSNPKEFLVNAFTGFLLMPPNAVRRAFADRKWNAAQATPEQCFRIACSFGVGYETLISHLAHSLRMISGERASQLQRVKLSTRSFAMLYWRMGECHPARICGLAQDQTPGGWHARPRSRPTNNLYQGWVILLRRRIAQSRLRQHETHCD